MCELANSSYLSSPQSANLCGEVWCSSQELIVHKAATVPALRNVLNK
jgi:hypothetical protein